MPLGSTLEEISNAKALMLQPEELARGIRDALVGEKLLLSDEEIRNTSNEFQTEMKLKRARTAKIVGEENKRKGEAFLTGNKAQEGILFRPLFHFGGPPGLTRILS